MPESQWEGHKQGSCLNTVKDHRAMSELQWLHE